MLSQQTNDAFESYIQTLVKNKLKRTRKKRLSKVPRQKNTKTIEIAYFKELKKITNLLSSLTLEILFPQIEPIIQGAKNLRPTVDTYDEEIEAFMSRLKTRFSETYSIDEMTTIAILFAKRVQEFNKNQVNNIYQKVLGMTPFTSEYWLEQEMKGFIKENVRLIKSIRDEYFDKVEGIIFRGARSGILTKDIKQEIRQRFAVNEGKAKLIARDQISKFNGSLTKLRQTDLGIQKYRWSTSKDERVRESHRANETRETKYGIGLYAWNDPPVTGHPGEDFQCRCVAIPIIEIG